MGGKAGLVADLEKVVQVFQSFFWYLTRAQLFVNDGFSDSMGWKVEAFAELFLEQTENCGKKGVRLPRFALPAKIGETILDFTGNFPLAPQARIIGQSLISFSHYQQREPGHHRHDLQSEEPGPLNEWRASNRGQGQIRFNVHDFVVRDCR